MLREARRQLQRAISANQAGRPVWAWFAAHHSAEAALHALRLGYSLNGRERILTRLLVDLPGGTVPESLIRRAEILDSHYIPIRMDELPLDVVRPNGAPPSQFAIDTAVAILELVERRLTSTKG